MSSDEEQFEHSAIYITFNVGHSSAGFFSDPTREAVVRVMMITQQCQLSGPGTRRRVIQTISFWGGDNLLERCGRPGVHEYPLCVCREAASCTYIAQTDAAFGLGWQWFGNVGYWGTRGGAKVAGDPEEAGRWAYVRHLRSLLFSLDATQHCKVREGSTGRLRSRWLHVWPDSSIHVQPHVRALSCFDE